jgi:hypothetical protein
MQNGEQDKERKKERKEKKRKEDTFNASNDKLLT